MTAFAITATPLSDPLYYLRNAQQVIQLCLYHYPDLLLAHEQAQLHQLLELEESTQALLIRMIMRKGPYFRHDQLQYAEVPMLDQAISALLPLELVVEDPSLTLSQLCTISKRPECFELAQYLLPEQRFARSITKKELQAQLLTAFKDRERPLSQWWPSAPFKLLQLNCVELFERLRLLFFGNLYQSWSEFVLSELNVYRFEKVPFTKEDRPFQQRSELDIYLKLHQLQQRVGAGEAVDKVAADITESLVPPSIAANNEWLAYRSQRVLYQLGREAERQQHIPLALRLYQQSQHRAAQIRHLRIQEKLLAPARVFAHAQTALQAIQQPEAQVSLQRIMQRCARKAKLDYQAPSKMALPSTELVLPRPAQGRVEQAVIQHFTREHIQLFHSENRLFTGLFALLFWPALFKPVPGAFFNPFQAGPADLFRPNFAQHRTTEIAQGFSQLSNGDYQRIIKKRFQEKQGISCSLLHWPSLSAPLLELSLTIIPAAHLAIIFRHLLLDLRYHSRGMPDLIELDTHTQQYRLIEVKGPGDRLQDHQQLWLATMLKQQLPVSVCHVRWQDQ